MTRPTAESTAAAESWLRSRQNLQSLVDEALEDPDIAEALAEANIPVAEARAAILEDPTILARVRTARSWSSMLRANQAGMDDWGLRSTRMRHASPVTRMVVAALAIVAYVVLLVVSVAAMPWWGNLLGLVGFFATLGYAVGLCGQDAWLLLRTASRSPNIARWPRYPLYEVVLPELLQFIDTRRAPDYGTTLSIGSVHNLYQDDDDAPIIITAGGQRLRRILERSTADAVAVAGHRGVGKTTAIRAVTRGLFSDPSSPPPLRVVASAPSRYEARDFVLHLHAVLAKQVLLRTGMLLRKLPEPEPPHRRVPGPLWVSAALVALAPIAYMALGGTFVEFLTDMRAAGSAAVAEFPRHVLAPFPTGAWFSPRSAALLLLYGALLLVGLGILARVLGLLSRPFGAMRELARPAVAELHDLARHQLDRIRFLQTYTSGWSGKVGIPLGSGDVGWTRGGQRAEQQLTHPEVVEAFREFAGRAADVLVRQGAIERIVIAVDELDKIAEPEKAHEFVNDIKGIFGVDGCLFLVAVSEDAISAFERRGIPVRDAFDSAFSEMVRMDPFTLAESRRWMSRRLVGVPEPFSCLCHCLSGGLPRDLRRSTVDMIDAVRETGSRDLESVAAVMIDRELDRKAHAFAAAARRLDDHQEVTTHLADLLLIGQVREPVALVELADRLVPDETSTIPSMRWQSACFVLFCATVLQVFTNDVTESDVDERVEMLGTARTQLAIDPRVAWRVLCDVRASYGFAKEA
jgi:hypothetical protein